MGPSPLVASDVIRVEGFTKKYGTTHAAGDVNLHVRRGELFGLIGSDGAGKSSLLKSIAGVQTFDAGTVNVLGVSLDSDAACERIKDRIGLMPQGLGQNLYGELSVEENVDFFARLRLVDERTLAERKEKLLAMTRLTRFKDRPMKNLSGGMKQKLGLVCTLMHEPELIILDEPTTGVDPVSRRDFWTILAHLVQERGITALISTAYMDEASRFHRVALMHEGRILATGEPDALHVQLPHGAVEPGAQLEDIFVALIGDGGHGAEPVRKPAETTTPAKQVKAIEALDLTCDFGSFRAVDHATFSVASGEIFGLLGANGAGKTTAIKMLTGILRPTSGTGYVAGVDMRSASQGIKERIGYMSQAFSLYTDLSVIENIRLYAGIYGLDRKQAASRTEWVMEMAGLADNRNTPAASLPMGLRQRLALGCALLHRPQVLFLDEPTSGVDPIGRRRFWRILFDLARQDGVAILVTTHHMSEAEYCDRLALMHGGRIIADASPEQLKRETEADAGVLLEIAASPLQRALLLLTEAGFTGASLHGKYIHVLSRDPEQDSGHIMELLGALGRAPSVTPQPLSIEDVFVHRITRLEQGNSAGAQP
ncbi:MAG TPA: ATP-binding cassette domain-containing protein [Noviherbaspirillum sp.]|uniref:ATP-binding cassette domain-containing protein n=1 Tax=Noviherbaspirillum sp. TaxID=1926288 RepID=UPI002B4A881E|nr:ATP-binding cassette domain-containing protein [Noviherbaspirillum sp.]HJV86231.1 ATP-binding cassette domain-containing protein [Noviherbaspirillum sp.]